jgi:hypothetical protein
LRRSTASGWDGVARFFIDRLGLSGEEVWDFVEALIRELRRLNGSEAE